MIRTIVIFFTILFSTVSYAETIKASVKRIYANGSSVSFRLYDDTCISTGAYYKFDLDTDVKKYWSSILLAAANTGGKVSVRVEACSPTATESTRVMYIYQDF